MSRSSSLVPLVKPLARQVLSLVASTPGIPSKVNVTQWGSPLAQAKHVIFYTGGMPASAEEPALHSVVSAHDDAYAQRNIHLVCIDKPGMGKSSFAYQFQIRRDWPVIMDQVAQQLQVKVPYGVMGMSNGGPYAMSSLTHPTLRHRVKAGCMLVGVSDPWASGYFSFKSPSTLFEGIYNSLPLALTGPLNSLALHAANLYLFRFGGFESQLGTIPPEAKAPLRRLIQDGAATLGIGAAIDCQQGLSPLFARETKNLDTNSVDRNATAAYRDIQVPVSLWYGTEDSTVPMSSADWLAEQIPGAKLYKVEEGHALYFFRVDEVLDEFVQVMDAIDTKGGDVKERMINDC
eukprot:scaffold1793_cov173-Amphora_coffeaeformis.AAC.13